LNPRPPGYEPGELPDCSTLPRHDNQRSLGPLRDRFQLEADPPDSVGMREVFLETTWSRRAARVAAASLAAVVLTGLLASVAVERAAAADQGVIAFVSDRDGDPEIFTVLPNGSSLTQLTNNTSWDTDPAWSHDAARIAFSSDRDGDDDIYVMSASGSGPVNLTNSGGGRDLQPDWSPDGSKIAFVRDGAIYVTSSSSGGALTRLTSGRSPSWSPDGTKIAFARPGPQNTDIYVMNADGTGATLLTSGLDADSPDWSPDGEMLAFEGTAGDSDASRIYTMRKNGTATTELPGSGEDFSPWWSPDGSSLVFTSIEVDSEIVVAAADGSGRRVVTSNPAYEFLPSWSPCTSGCPSPAPSGSGAPSTPPQGSSSTSPSSSPSASPSPSSSPSVSPSGSPLASPSASPSVSPGSSPAPGPTEPTLKMATKTLLDVSSSARFIKTAGRVTPAIPGEAVSVKLAKRMKGHWAPVGRKAPMTDADGRFATRFRNPSGARRCRLIATFHGTQQHLASRMVRHFSC
jgi:Tol biopolymer transport system component